MASLIALTVSPQLALYTLIFSFALQAAESNVLEPLVQQFIVKVPPVLTIVIQIVFTSLFGFAGLLVATQLVAVSIVVIRMLYVQDVLGDKRAGSEDHRPEERGSEEASGQGMEHRPSPFLTHR